MDERLVFRLSIILIAGQIWLAGCIWAPDSVRLWCILLGSVLLLTLGAAKLRRLLRPNAACLLPPASRAGEIIGSTLEGFAYSTLSCAVCMYLLMTRYHGTRTNHHWETWFSIGTTRVDEKSVALFLISLLFLPPLIGVAGGIFRRPYRFQSVPPFFCYGLLAAIGLFADLVLYLIFALQGFGGSDGITSF